MSTYIQVQMDPSLDPPATAVEPVVQTTNTAAANPIPNISPFHSHPPYAEMITAAISALKERDGSSKKAIAKYIERQYLNLPPDNSAMLTHHLKWLQKGGHLIKVKRSYKLPVSSSSPEAAADLNNTEEGVSVSSLEYSKKRPGRPPKPKPIIAQPVDAAAPSYSAAVGSEQMLVSLGLVDAPATSGRGRPRKPKVLGEVAGGGLVKATIKRGRGRPPRPKFGSVVAQLVRRGRGRPRKSGIAAISDGKKLSGRPRGRPKKNFETAVVIGDNGATSVSIGGGGVDNSNSDVVEGTGGAVMILTNGNATAGGVVDESGFIGLPAKRRGKPPNVYGSNSKKPRRLSGKPLGRPRKSVVPIQELQAQAAAPQPLMAYQDLKSKLEHLQLKVKQAVSTVKPYLNPEFAATALGALQELEDLATVDMDVPLYVQGQELL